MLVGDIGEIEKLAECPCHRHQLFAAQVQQQGLQLVARLAEPLPRAFGQAADLLDQLQEVIALGRGDGIPQHSPQQADVAAQGGVIQIRHVAPRYQPAFSLPSRSTTRQE